MAELIDQADSLLASLQTATGMSLSLAEAKQLFTILRGALCATGSICNLHLPIHKLPDEILALVFSHVPSVPDKPESDDVDWSWSFANVEELAPILLVCRRWHNVAISTPTLWTSIVVYNDVSPQTELRVRRSGVLPLLCRLLLAPDDRGSSLHFLSEQHTQIRELQLSAPFVWDQYEVPPPLRYPMPYLEQALIRHVRSHPDTRPVLEQKVLFEGYTPCLRRLRIDRIGGFPGNRFERLTDLDLAPPAGHRVQLANLQAFLARCPMLQHLVVRYFCFRETTLAYPRQPLPHLRTLIMWNVRKLLTCDVLLNSLSLPQNISMALILPGEYDFDDISTRGLNPLTLSPQCKKVTRMAIAFDDKGWTMTVSIVGMALVHTKLRSDGYFHPVSQWPALISWLSPHGSAVTELWLSFIFHDSVVRPRYSPEFVATILDLFPSLNSFILRIDDYARCSFAGTLDCWLHWSGFPSIPSRISHLRLCFSHNVIPGPALDKLTQELASRAHSGNRLSSLIFDIPPRSPMNSTLATLEGLADFVEVRWSWSFPWMEVPDVYRKRPHSLWPQWEEELVWEHDEVETLG